MRKSAKVAPVPIGEKLVLSVEEMSALTGYSIETLYVYLQNGDLPSLPRTGQGPWRSTRRQLDAWLEKMEQQKAG